jgi:hypothetical protein
MTDAHLEPYEWEAIKAASIIDPVVRANAVLSIVQKQEQRIKALESLLRYWKSRGQSPFGSKSFDQLVHETEQILAED